jgi:hypothetical protein
VRNESERQESGGWPAEEEGDRVRQQGSGPAKVSLYVAVAMDLGVALGG